MTTPMPIRIQLQNGSTQTLTLETDVALVGGALVLRVGGYQTIYAPGAWVSVNDLDQRVRVIGLDA